LSTIGHIFGSSRFFDGPKLNKGIVSFHVNAEKFAVGFEEHFQIFSLGGIFVKVDHKECVRRLDVPATIVFLALNSSVSSCKLGTESRRDIFYFPESLRQ
jgi:hypothetical protein